MKGKRAAMTVVDEIRSLAEDLAPGDRQWAEAIARLVSIPIGEAEKRIRRIRHDTKLSAHLQELSAQIGRDSAITNIEWSGPEMKNITVSVVANPMRVIEQKPQTPNELFLAQIRAQQAMRIGVAQFELARVFRRSVVSLPSLALGMGGLKVEVKPSAIPGKLEVRHEAP